MKKMFLILNFLLFSQSNAFASEKMESCDIKLSTSKANNSKKHMDNYLDLVKIVHQAYGLHAINKEEMDILTDKLSSLKDFVIAFKKDHTKTQCIDIEQGISDRFLTIKSGISNRKKPLIH